MTTPHTIVITPDRNTHDNDYSGAFEPEAIRYMKAVPGVHSLIKIDVSNGMPTRLKSLFAQLDALKGHGFSAVAVFCHGWNNGIQAGVRNANVPDFVRRLCGAIATGTSSSDPLHVILYCCSTAAGKDSPESASEVGGDGGFADILRDQFCVQGKPWVRVYAHTSRGHTTMNPQARMFEGKGSPVGITGAEWVIRPQPPKNVLWPRWVAALAGKPPFDQGTMKEPAVWLTDPLTPIGSVPRQNLRFIAPFMTIAELHGVLIPDGVV
jgi:hypothetical protein